MATKEVKKPVKKEATNKVTFTKKQVETVAAFYEKMGKKVPAFLAKKLI